MTHKKTSTKESREAERVLAEERARVKAWWARDLEVARFMLRRHIEGLR